MKIFFKVKQATKYIYSDMLIVLIKQVIFLQLVRQQQSKFKVKQATNVSVQSESSTKWKFKVKQLFVVSSFFF